MDITQIPLDDAFEMHWRNFTRHASEVRSLRSQIARLDPDDYGTPGVANAIRAEIGYHTEWANQAFAHIERELPQHCVEFRRRCCATAHLQKKASERSGKRVYRLSVPLEGWHEVAVSTSTRVDSETSIFPSRGGKICDWGELPGSQRGVVPAETALADAGYRVGEEEP